MKPIILSEKPLIRAYNCDCMDLMADKPDKHYSLACCDPPYSRMCNLQGGSSKKMEHGWGELWVPQKHEEWNKTPPPEYFSDLLRVSGNQIIWGGNYFIEYLSNSSCFIIWDKGQRDFSLADAELAWASFDKPVRVFNYSRAQNNRTDRIHISQKPVPLYLWLLTNYAKPGQTILDTHGGSFSSAIACWKMNYDLDICEVDEEYFEAACERFERETRQGSMF